MTDDPKHPWPRSWPPFWRAVLHVGIATAAGNVAFGVGLCLILWAGEGRSRVWQEPVLAGLPLSWATTIFTAFIPAALRRASCRTLFALATGFCSGWLVSFVLALLLYNGGVPMAFMRTHRPDPGIPVCIAAGVLIVFCGAYITAVCFKVHAARSDDTVIGRAWVVGGCLLSAANAWMWSVSSFMPGLSDLPGLVAAFPRPLAACLKPIVEIIWTFGLFNLAYATMATMLLNAAEEAKAAGGVKGNDLVSKPDL